MCNNPILFVDDDMISLLLNCAVLRECGFVVLEATSYSEARAVLDRQPQLLALVTDIDLGAGPDGFELARGARRIDPDLPVVYMSGSNIGRYAQEGVCGSRFIPKPLDPYQVVRALDDATPMVPAHLH
jgi:CheY-like chemotaxis protein